MTDLYADRLGNVTIASGTVRLDFLRLTSIDPETKQARLDPALRLVLPVDGMMQTVEMLDRIRNELVQKAREAGAAQTDAAPA